MARIVNVSKPIRTTGELIEALKEFGPDMPLKREAVIYRLWPRKDEAMYREDKRGVVWIEEDDGTFDD